MVTKKWKHRRMMGIYPETAWLVKIAVLPTIDAGWVGDRRVVYVFYLLLG